MPGKLHQCVEKAMARGHSEQSAYAICNANLASLSDHMTDEEVDRMMGATPIAMSLATLRAVPFRIVRENADGSGVVEIPIMKVGEIDLSKTAKPVNKTWKITPEILSEVVSNFGRYGSPIPVGVHPHAATLGDTAGPMPAFFNSMDVRGDSIWASVFATPMLFHEIRSGAWRSFSPDVGLNVEWPSITLKGWSVYGGVFTNRPAQELQFGPPHAIAAAFMPTRVQTSIRIQLSLEERQEGKMPEDKTISLATHEAAVADFNSKIALANDKITRLETNQAGYTSEIATLRKAVSDGDAALTAALNDKTLAVSSANRLEAQSKAQGETIRQLETAKTELELKVKKQDRETSDHSIKLTITEAVEKGLAPALFDGWEPDPTAWMEKNFASLAAFQSHVRVLTGVGPKISLGSGTVKSGHDPAKAADPEKVTLTAEEEAQMKKLGLGIDFVGVTTEEQARAVMEARKTAAAAKK
jgi:hypothetical protein